MNLRNTEGYQTHLHHFIQFDVLVKCPSCTRKAFVKPQSSLQGKIEETVVKLVCTHCGHSKLLSETPSSIISQSNTKARFYSLGGGTDPYFDLPLWLTINVEENTLWAYNTQHLQFLKDYINAKLRERNGQENLNKSVASRLPKWMTASKNRTLILKKIGELEKMLK